MPSSNNQAGQGRRFRPKPFDFSYILSPYPPFVSHLANSLDSLSLANETAIEITTQNSPSVNKPALCSRLSCRNPVRINRKQCGNCIDKNSARKRARTQQRRKQGIKDPITGETTKLCADCGVSSDKYRCGRCYKKKIASNQVAYYRRREKGLCTRCGGEMDREGSCCKRCHCEKYHLYNKKTKSTDKGMFC